MAKILVVDDDPDHNTLVADALHGDNHIVETVTSGNEAQELLRLAQFDLIILDWTLTDMTGIDVLDKIRKFCATPVIMLTAHGRATERAEGLDAGADDYLIKPFSATELTARIRAVLRRGSKNLSPILTAGKYTLDAGKLTATAGKTEAKLQPQEFALLEFLARHPNDTFKAEVLMARAWPTSSGAGTDAVRTAVKQIRKRLNDESIIETIPGIGYRLGK